MDIAFISSIAIFTVTFAAILSERIHRTVIAFFGAITMIVAGMILDFYHPHEALEAIDFNTIGLLFGMMVLVAILEKTGCFQYLGIITAKKTKGSPFLLIVALGAITSVLSMILDNVTTIILIVPVTIIIAKIIEINPTPILMAEALLSNIGGTATLVGDPPNIMIGSAAPFTFNDFLVHSLPVVLVSWVVTLAVIRFVFRKDIAQKPKNIEDLMKMNEKEAITDKKTLKKMILIFTIVIGLFFAHGALHMPPALVALIGAALALMMVSPTQDPQDVLERVELSVLFFFGSLFMIVGGLEHAGVLEHVATLLISGASENLLMTALIVLWTSALLSSIVDNIPFTVAMIPIIGYLGTTGVPVELLWWALVFGVGFGGNGTPIGSSAGVIVVAKSEKTDNPISFLSWMKQGVPTTIISLSVVSVFLVAFTEFWM